MRTHGERMFGTPVIADLRAGAISSGSSVKHPSWLAICSSIHEFGFNFALYSDFH